MAVYDISGNRIDEGGGLEIQSYFVDEMADTISKVRALQTEPCIIVPVCTDIHYKSTSNCLDGNTFELMIDNMRYLSSKLRLDAVACLGDMTDGDVAQATTTSRINHMFDRFRELELPMMFAAGNHDANGYYNTPWYTQDQLAQILYANNRNDAVYSSGTQNWYIDIPEKGVRFLSLCSASTDSTRTRYRFPDNTDTFVSNALSTTPSGYIVVLLIHLSPNSSQNAAEVVQSNASGVLSAINTWRNADNTHTIIQLMGHSHSDFSFSSPWLVIATNCQKAATVEEDYTVTQEMIDQGITQQPLGAKKWRRAIGEACIDCWDVAVIRPASRKINMVRFGAGEDREFTF